MESFGGSFNAVLAPAVHLAALNAKFDVLRDSSSLDVLMASMGALSDKGYWFTNHDRAALTRIAG